MNKIISRDLLNNIQHPTNFSTEFVTLLVINHHFCFLILHQGSFPNFILIILYKKEIYFTTPYYVFTSVLKGLSRLSVFKTTCCKISLNLLIFFNPVNCTLKFLMFMEQICGIFIISIYHFKGFVKTQYYKNFIKINLYIMSSLIVSVCHRGNFVFQ